MLSILFGCKKFTQYLFGREVKVHIDQKPLIAIHTLALAKAPVRRLRRVLLQLQAYNTELTHIPGMDIPIANTLSRKFLPDTYLQLTEGMDLHVHTVISSLRMSGRRMEEARSATQADPQMKVLMNVIQYALPECRKKNVSHVLEFWNQGDELSKIDGNIFKGCTINIPRDVLYILVVEFYNNYFEIEKLSMTTSQAVIENVNILNRLGIPQKVLLDNSPQ